MSRYRRELGDRLLAMRLAVQPTAQLAAREPSLMRQRYYEMTCEDGHTVTRASPART